MKVALQKTLRGGKNFFLLDVSFEASSGSILAIIGPSGAGKTTVLKMIAGLAVPDQGRIEVQDQLWFDSRQRISLRTQQRSIGYVFQDYALFPNMSVRDNLRYALSSKHDDHIIDEVLELMHIQNLQQQQPSALSGGQQQRVALARAIVRRPQILLLDEPFAALDKSMRTKLQDDLIELHHRYQTTTLLVSHDPTEIARMANEVVVLQEGKIVQQGKPTAILTTTTSILMQGEILSIEEDKITIINHHSLSTLRVPNASNQYQVGDMVSISTDHYELRKEKKV